MQQIRLPHYTIGTDVFSALAAFVIQGAYRRILLTGGHTALSITQPRIAAALAHHDELQLETLWHGGECTQENIHHLSETALKMDAELIIAAGGGKALDTAKGAAEIAGRPLITVPTIASTCAATTLLSILYTEHGNFASIMLLRNAPLHIFIDTGILANAPARYLWAGIGDTLSKFYEVELVTRGKELSHNAQMGKALSVLCAEPLLKYGLKALEDNRIKQATPDLTQVVLNIIISTGIVSNSVGDEYAAACAHGLFYGLTLLPQIEKHHLHGEVIAYAVLVLLMMDKRREEILRLYPFYHSLGLPTTLRALDVPLDRRLLSPVLKKAAAAEDTAKVPYRITPEMFYQAMVELEQYAQ